MIKLLVRHPTSNNIGFLNLGYSTVLIMSIDTAAIMISANSILNIPER